MLSGYKYVGWVLKGKGSPEDGKLEEVGAHQYVRIEGVCLYRTFSSNITWQA